ncbi:hypothetical protein CAPTEDRAFT_224935 [Capitella teleta]|uniref:Uncharacterized protein n=1 Tax=Capitella teleta TaxID=283909 RepID=R7U5E0_CAPTE|nr:hypothetical protein CAPTEDRAFT_224935 [Capitella teleta]|eukprot:ELT98340.1 hypothetical protein CAPTEDRAFT_224935 [Capitella teleta]
MFSALEHLGVQKVTNILNKIYDTGNIPQDLLKSVFIALLKKPEADLQHLLDIVDRESEKAWTQHQEPRHHGHLKKADTPTCNLKLKDSTFVQVEKFKYLGSTIYSDGRSAQEIRISFAEYYSDLPRYNHVMQLLNAHSHGGELADCHSDCGGLRTERLDLMHFTHLVPRDHDPHEMDT